MKLVFKKLSYSYGQISNCLGSWNKVTIQHTLYTRMLVLFFEFAEFSSDVVSSDLPENIPLPVISFNLYPGAGFPMSLSPVVLPVSGERLTKPIRPTPIVPVPPSSKMANLNLKGKASRTNLIEPLPLSLNLPSPTPRSQDQSPANSGHSSPSSSSAAAFQAMSAAKFGGGGDSIISVA